MKLRSIALAGILGMTALTTTGCLEDAADDIIDAFDIKTGKLVLFNSTVNPIDILVNNEIHTVGPQNILGDYSAIVTEDDHTIDISYTGSTNSAVLQNNNGAYVYAVAPACTDGYVVDIVGNEKLRVMNVSGVEIPNADLNISLNGVKIALPSNALDCKVTATYTGPTDGVWRVRAYGADFLGIDGYTSNDPDVQVEIVIYNVNAEAEAAGIALIP